MDALRGMKLLLALSALSLAFGCSPSLTLERVAAAERARADAIARRDTAAYRLLVAPDLYVVDTDGSEATQSDRLSAVDAGNSANARRVESEVGVRLYGSVALVTGRSTSQIDGTQKFDFFTRIWADRNGRLQLVASHYTDITPQMTDDDPSAPGSIVMVPAEPIAADQPGGHAQEELVQAIHEQHRAYWSKDPERYRRFAGPDLIRVANQGVRGREDLIRMMRGNARLPAPPSDQLDIRVRVFGNTAVTSWIDQGTGLLGNPTRLRFTVVFVRRAIGWQMVLIQSTGVRGFGV
jgi:hypothetical protein